MEVVTKLGSNKEEKEKKNVKDRKPENITCCSDTK